MIMIVITEEAHKAVAAGGRPGRTYFGGKQLPNGDFEIEVDEEVYDEMVSRCNLSGESFSELIIRIFNEVPPEPSN